MQSCDPDSCQPSSSPCHDRHRHPGLPVASTSLPHDRPFDVPDVDDPDDFYRDGPYYHHPTTYTTYPDIVVDGAMTTVGSRPRQLDPQRGVALQSARQNLRSVSGPAATTTPSNPNGATSIPVSTSTSRPPVKNLVQRFNQSASPNTSAGAKAKRNGNGTRHASSPASSISSVEPLRESEVGQSKLQDPRYRDQFRGANGSPTARRGNPSHAQPDPSLPVSSLNLREGGFGRPLLFGELRGDVDGMGGLGYGIAAGLHRRRGSEGAMHRPSAMFAHARSHTASETSPFFANPLTLDTTLPDRTASAHGHRRSRSDLSTLPFSRQVSMDHVDRPDQTWPAALKGPQSRIPRAIPKRRTSTTSESASSIQSSRTSSALSDRRAGSASPCVERRVNSRSHLNKENFPRNRPCTPPTTLSSRRYHTSPNKSGGGPKVQVQVKVPPPTTSPPLRSSRPRQPVSIASTSASRAKINERLMAAAPSTNGARTARLPVRTAPQKPKPKRDLGLAGISIAARKAQIEQSLRDQGISASRSRSTSLSREESPMGSRQDDASAPAPDATEGAHVGDQDVREGPESSKDRRLTLEVADLPAPRQTEPLTGATEFEGEESPILGALAQPRHQTTSDAGRPTDDAAPPMSLADEPTSTPGDRAATVEEAYPSPQGEEGVLNQVLKLRQSRSSSTSRTTFAEDSTSEKEDGESMKIMIGLTPTADQPRQGWRPQSTRSSSQDAEARWSTHSYDSSHQEIDFLHEDAQQHYESLDTRASVAPDDSISIAPTPARGEPPAQDWTPSIHYAPADARLTLDSEAYSVIQKVLDYYHNAQHVTPELAHEFQQQVQAVTPDLAGYDSLWTSKEKTEQYLADLMREGTSVTSLSPDETPRQNDQKYLRPHSLEEYEQSLSPEGEHGGIAIIYGQPEVYGKPSRQDDGPGVEKNEDRPIPPPKDWRYSPRPATPLHSQLEPVTPVEPASRLTTPFRPNLPEISTVGEGLGLSMPVSPPSESHGRVHPMPHDTLPPVASGSSQRVHSKTISSPPSPSIYSRNPASSVFPPAPTRTAPGSLEMKRSETPSSPPPRSSASKSHEGLRAPREELDPDTRKRLTQRRHVARELLDTEAAYYQDIKVVEDIYKGTSHSVADVTDDDRKVLFGNCEDIVSFSMKFTDSLKPAMASIYKLPKSQRWDSKRGSFSTPAGTPVDQPNGGMGPVSDLNDRRTFIGSVFLEHMADMERVYSYYAQNHGAANTRLIELQQRPHVRQWLTECNNYAGDITSAWSLDALIVKPTQRLLKYSMLIEGLIKTTPEDHPDRETLVAANAEMLALCARVNESKGQQELVEKVAGRGRKASDSKSLAAPFSKAFGRKLKQQIGLSETSVEDPDYDAISQKFGGHFFQLQIVMRDVEKYVDDVQAWMDQNILLATELDGWLDISQGSAPELESKWRKYAVTIRQVMQVCLTEHKAEVRQNVVQPIMTLWKYHERPQKLMNKRKKRLPEYSKYRNAKDCGAKPDKKTEEVALEFEAINASLKEDLPKLYAKTKTLIDACHKNLVWSQFTWYSSCYQKLQTVIDDVQSERTLKGGLDDVVSTFESDYRSVEAELERIETVMRNLKEMATFSPAATYSTDDFSMKRPSTFGSSKRTQSINSDQSVVIINTPDPSQRTSASFPALPELGSTPLIVDPGPQSPPMGRTRAGSAMSSRGPSTPRSLSAQAVGASYFPQRPATAAGRSTEPMAAFNRLSLDTPEAGRSAHSSFSMQPAGALGPQNRTSSAFSSALPMRMSDSPTDTREEPSDQSENDYEVMFLAASLFEFNIAHDRREAGFPYLVYVPGEIFDVIGQKGELWLARNQDDSSRTIGWIWEKHFARILPED